MQGRSLRVLKAGLEIGEKSGRRKFDKICMRRDGRNKRGINSGRCEETSLLHSGEATQHAYSLSGSAAVTATAAHSVPTEIVDSCFYLVT